MCWPWPLVRKSCLYGHVRDSVAVGSCSSRRAVVSYVARVSERRWRLVATVRQLVAMARNSSLTRHLLADVDGAPLRSGGLVTAMGFIWCGFLVVARGRPRS
jgi:hypothetical protein